MKPSTGPKCPNHGELLMDVPFPIPERGTGICPVSGCPFDYEWGPSNTEEVVQDKFGNLTKKHSWTISGEEK